MKRRRDLRADDASLPLFDLPLQPAADHDDAPQSERHAPAAEPPADQKLDQPRSDSQEPVLPVRSALFANEGPDGAAGGDDDDDDSAAGDLVVSLAARLYAGVADLSAILLAVALGAGAALALGVSVSLDAWPTLALLGLSFSFIYTVVPLAFWGQTPGMAWSGLEARAADDQPLTFQQTSQRWLGGALTVALAGLPMFLGLTGASLADRLSGSITVVAGSPSSRLAGRQGQ